MGCYFLFLVPHLLKAQIIIKRKLKSFSLGYKSSKHNSEQKIIHVSIYVKSNLFAEIHKLLGKYFIKL